ncbi:MAG: nucleotidyltransferase domain-containing protein, partial [bacterium]
INEAVGLLASPSAQEEVFQTTGAAVAATPEEHWRWRLRMAERIASQLDPERFGVRAMYVFGSTKNSTAGPGSDVDLLVHLSGNLDDREELALWLDGWSRALAEINYLRTGYRTEQLLDIHWITDKDIAKKTSFAAKIDAVTDAARPLPLGTNLGANGQPPA